MGSIGGFEYVLIFLAILLLFGAKRIPDLARGLGQGIKEFRKASDDIKREIDRGKEEISDSTRFDEKKENKETESEKN
ncbi:MAG TPA: twin-arginine translocase TatA/TatE family subunit [Balneolaceae bacterium]|nr:twin-arginine translocase TatA/TatE family subunit [Balneolaceae bacterium]